MTVKIEINTFERAPELPLQRLPYEVDSPWYTRQAHVLTFGVAELMATKLRALYQRCDLFDLWLVLQQLDMSPEVIVDAFSPYRPDGYTSARARLNLESKTAKREFRADLEQLIAQWLSTYDVDSAAELIISELINRVD